MTANAAAWWDEENNCFMESRKDYADPTREIAEETGCKFIDENKIGWIFFKDKKEIGVGEHKLTVKYVDSNGDVLDEKDCQFKILNEVE